MQRHMIGIEIASEYVEATQKRLQREMAVATRLPARSPSYVARLS
jgi:DNA modification methylase